MNIVVLAGGNSPERAVSLTSGRLVCAALRRRGHRVLLLDVWRGLTDEAIGDDPMTLFRGAPKGEDEALPDLPGGETPVGENVLRLCKLADVVFLALHGAAGENGQVQAMLDCFGIRYTGSGHGGSYVAMDKPLCKMVMRQGGVLTPDWCVIDEGEEVDDQIHQPHGEPVAHQIGAEGGNAEEEQVLHADAQQPRQAHRPKLAAQHHGKQRHHSVWHQGKQQSGCHIGEKPAFPLQGQGVQRVAHAAVV